MRAGWFAASLLVACSASDGGPTAVHLHHAPEEHLQQVVDACNDRARGRYRIVYHRLPRDADGQREQLVRRLAAGDAEMDVLGLDVTWVAEFAEAGWVREWAGTERAEAERGVLAAPLQSAMWRGHVYAAPKNTNVQLLWYRSDLVEEPPATWSDMIRVARVLAAQGKPSAILMTGAQYEGLVVVYNDLVASTGGRILSDDGMSAVVDAGAVRALELLRQLASVGVTSPSFANQKEDDVRLSFQAGGGAFQVNWPFVFAAARTGNPALFATMRYARLPRVDPERPSRATIGGVNLAIARSSRHPAEAYAAALCLRSADSQKFSAVHDGVPPTIEALYDDPDVVAAYPMKDVILGALSDAALRPVTPAYQNVSSVLAALLSPPRAIEPERTARRMRRELSDALASRGVLP